MECRYVFGKEKGKIIKIKLKEMFFIEELILLIIEGKVLE